MMTSLGSPDQDDNNQQHQSEPVLDSLSWTIYLRQSRPQFLPGLISAILFAVICIYLIFHNPLPAIAALLLLVGSTADYLFPLRYSLDAEGIRANGLISRYALRWNELKRQTLLRNGVLLSPLAKPSRLDVTRGVMLRFAPAGSPGDRESVLRLISHYAPEFGSTESKPDVRI